MGREGMTTDETIQAKNIPGVKENRLGFHSEPTRKVHVAYTRLSGGRDGWVKATTDHKSETVTAYGPTIGGAIERLRNKIEVLELKGNPRDVEVWW